ncbi:hypothetical protein L1049_007355 [Liquidambar formosana]|uniref:Uncharacterized protein n=1 Tax=Liquidambar formosana TaxID=63359 RepID=A0AAP0N4Z7_LIQFO
MSNPEEVGFKYWLRWQVPVCALIFVVPAVVALRFNKRVTIEPLNSYDLWVPCWRKLHPRWLLFYRAFAFVSMASLLYQIVASEGLFAFYFYTQWTFTLVMVYFMLGTIISAHGCWVCSHKPPPENGERTEFLERDLEGTGSTAAVTFRAKEFRGAIKLQSHCDQEEIQQRAGFWGYLMQTIYQTCAGAAILTDIVFWCLLVPFLLHVRLDLLMACMHSLNAVFLILDTSLNSLVSITPL